MVNIIYISPMGRNCYTKTCKYTYKEFKRILETVKASDINRIIRESEIKEERLRMTNSLRYDILKRDGFKCKLCGSSVDDGVKLHVDHIIPVSKGGKTKPSNLRVLCDRCNTGKRDKIENQEIISKIV